MSTEQVIASSSSVTVPLEVAPSKNGRTPGKAHKSAKAPVRRSYISQAIKTPFDKRREEDKRREAIKAVETEMKEDKAAEKQMKRDKLKQRRDREAEKLRSEQMAARMSARKLQRMKKRQGRTKKING